MARKTIAYTQLPPERAYNIQEEQSRNAIGRRIAELRREKGLSLAEFSECLRVMGLSLDRTTIGKWETGRSAPNAYQLIAVSRFFGIDSADFFTSRPAKDTLNSEGIMKVEAYRADLAASGKYRPQPLTIIAGIVYRKMPLATMPVSAGPGVWLDADNFEEISVPEDTIPAGAEFGVRISGKSMEPVYHNNQIVWVQRCESLRPGEVGIIVYDGEGYLKVYEEQEPDEPEAFTDAAGVVHKQPVMVSYNPEYAPKAVKPGLGFFVCGRVLR